MKNVLELPDEEILEEVWRLCSAYKLKHTVRYAGERNPESHSESVAEHIFALIYLAHYFLQHEPVGPSLNTRVVYDTLLFHDFPEIKHGDVVTYQKTAADEERERDAAKEVFEALPSSLGPAAFERWHEYEEHETPETQFAYALDKLEPIFELFDPVNERSLKRLKITREMHVGNKYRACREYPVMMRFLEVMTEDMQSRNVFWVEGKN